jgi:hypothetical protein
MQYMISILQYSSEKTPMKLSDKLRTLRAAEGSHRGWGFGVTQEGFS